MSDKRKTVLITGATGMMGREAVKHFLTKSDMFVTRILVRPSFKNIFKMLKFAFNPHLKIVWGDMTKRKVIARAVSGADYVLHLGAMVSPKADLHPALTMRTNLGATQLIIDAIKAQPDADDIALVYIGTVGQTGCRVAPVHWGRCGDPMKGSMFDVYSTSKIAAERAVFESGLRKWVSLRQTSMLPIRMSGSSHPIIHHQHPNNVLEWSTAEESAVLLAKICEDNMPKSFWRRCYNIGGGEKWRFTYWEFINMTLKPLGVTFDAFFDASDLALYNFHGHWFTDSDALNEMIPYRSLDPETYFGRMMGKIETISSIPLIKPFLPKAKQLHKKNKRVAALELGTAWMCDEGREEWIKAFFGSSEKKNAICGWQDTHELISPPKEPTYLDHGYDESKPVSALDIDDMNGAAEFRGGKCLSASMEKGDLYTPLKWQCAFGHDFDATPNLVLRGGHWCPQCEREAWNYAEIAKVNPFFAQVWTPIHGDEDDVYIKKQHNDLSIGELK